MLFQRAFRTVGRKSECKRCDLIAVPAITEQRVGQASGLSSVPMPFECRPKSGRAMSLAPPGGPQLVEASLRWTRKRSLADPFLQWADRRYERCDLRAHASRQQVNLGVRH